MEKKPIFGFENQKCWMIEHKILHNYAFYTFKRPIWSNKKSFWFNIQSVGILDVGVLGVGVLPPRPNGQKEIEQSKEDGSRQRDNKEWMSVATEITQREK